MRTKYKPLEITDEEAALIRQAEEAQGYGGIGGAAGTALGAALGAATGLFTGGASTLPAASIGSGLGGTIGTAIGSWLGGNVAKGAQEKAAALKEARLKDLEEQQTKSQTINELLSPWLRTRGL